jgi:hypothetical protein
MKPAGHGCIQQKDEASPSLRKRLYPLSFLDCSPWGRFERH